MYNLRGINNMYSEHAGQRSDFIIVGHPEFQQGKVVSSRTTFPQWDNSRQPSKPGKHLARSRSTGALVQQLYSPGPIGQLKERALSKSSKSTMNMLPSSPRGTLGNSFSEFEKALMEVGESEEPFQKHGDPSRKLEQPRRTAAGVAHVKGHSATCRNFASLHSDMMAIRERLKQDPKGTKKQLISTGAWKYYAAHIEQDRQLEGQLRRDRQRCEPAVRSHVESPTGAMTKTL